MSTFKLVTFDLDDTLIRQNSWVALNRALGIDEAEDNRLYNLYHNGSLSYDGWMSALLAHYRASGRASRNHIVGALTNYELVSDAEECISQIRDNGIETALITGSIDVVAHHVAKRLGITHVFACTKLVFDKNDILTHIEHSGDEHTAKVNYLKGLIAELGITPNECVCVGDGANDREMFELTGHGITFRSSPIESSAWKIVDTLPEIPPLLVVEGS